MDGCVWREGVSPTALCTPWLCRPDRCGVGQVLTADPCWPCALLLCVCVMWLGRMQPVVLAHNSLRNTLVCLWVTQIRDRWCAMPVVCYSCSMRHGLQSGLCWGSRMCLFTTAVPRCPSVCHFACKKMFPGRAFRATPPWFNQSHVEVTVSHHSRCGSRVAVVLCFGSLHYSSDVAKL